MQRWFITAIAAEGSLTTSIMYTVPDTIPDGAYYILAKVSSFRGVTDSDATNNEYVGPQMQVGNRPPVPVVEVSGTECNSTDETADVTLSAEHSYDPDGDYVFVRWLDPAGVEVSDQPIVTISNVPLGAHVYTLQIWDQYTAADPVVLDVPFTAADTTPPTSTVDLSGTPGNDGWWLSAVDMDFSATDTCTGVKEIHWTITGPGYVDYEKVSPPEAPEDSISADGIFEVSYWAVDNAGNVEEIAPLPDPTKVAPTPPGSNPCIGAQCEPIAPPQPTCVTVYLHPYADVSGAYIAEYSLDGGVTWIVYDDSQGVFLCNTTTIEYRVTSPAGNVHYNIIEIKIDQTPPEITIHEPQGGAVYPECQVPAPSYEVIYGHIGKKSESAETTSAGAELVDYTFTVTAEDLANRVSQDSKTYEVVESIEGLKLLVADYKDAGVISDEDADDLDDDLARAENPSGGQAHLAVGALEDFQGKVNEIRSTIGNTVADILWDSASCFICDIDPSHGQCL
jgi:hypothetical protein